VSYKSRHNERQ